ncbi:GDSL-type esterase/lipase family protein [Brevundimonas sp. LM2]|uniref:GDSL-type esterase/lipase family protein n=1 Tax=Brevundimonas sp. LM2 TaxID=1938605 RepID=UPI0012375A61|nr:GDSL-type esterase/lipase family protein [Brevundimonas sp. LM2]
MMGSLGVLAAASPAQERPYAPLASPVSALCPDGLCQPQGLASFFTALDRPGPPVRIVQFGDSHTAAGDIEAAFLWRLRGRFERRAIELSSYGLVGVTLRDLAARAPLLSPDAPAPDLVVLAYGTNDGFDDGLDAVAYEALLRAQVERVRQAAPGASLLILGAPEALRGAGEGTCPGDLERRWTAPAGLAVVREVQHRVAASERVAFWDWKGRMGGDCSAFALAQGETPLMRGDGVHFTRDGGDWIGGLLFADLMTAYARRGG